MRSALLYYESLIRTQPKKKKRLHTILLKNIDTEILNKNTCKSNSTAHEKDYTP
jgi:hypothetical protein